MARGDVHWFSSYTLNSGIFTSSVNLATDVIKLAYLTNGTTLSAALADPRWSTGGTTTLSAFEVSTSTGYVTGGSALASVTWTQTGNTVSLSAANVTVAQDTTGFTTAYWAVGYDNTTANKYGIFFVDLGGPVGISAGALTITWSSNGIAVRTNS